MQARRREADRIGASDAAEVNRALRPYLAGKALERARGKGVSMFRTLYRWIPRAVKPPAKAFLLLGRIIPIVAFLGVFGLSLGDAVAELLPICSWPFQVAGQGLLNVATPDTNSTYWVMPL